MNNETVKNVTADSSLVTRKTGLHSFYYTSWSPVTWRNGRDETLKMFDSPVVRQFSAIGDGTIEKFNLGDLDSKLAEIGGSVLWFKDDYAKPDSANLPEVKKASQPPVVKKVVKDFAPSMIPAITLYGILWFFIFTPFIADKGLALTVAWMILSLAEFLFIAFCVSDLNQSRIKNKRLLIENSKPQPTGENDELYLVGLFSPLVDFIRESDEVALMVREKLRSSPSNEELTKWGDIVHDLFQLKQDFPADMVPLHSEEAGSVFDSLENKVDEIRAKKEKQARLERESRDRDIAERMELDEISSEIDEENFRNNAIAVKTGAMVFIDGLQPEEVE